MSDGLFSEFERANRPLSDHLWRQPEVRELLERVRRAGSVKELQTFKGASLAKQLEAARPTPPTAGPLLPARIDEWGGKRRSISPGTSVPTDRYYAKTFVEGEIDFCRYWPDTAPDDLEAIDTELIQQIGGLDALQHADEELVSQYWEMRTLWQAAPVEEGGPWALYTYIDATSEEILAAADDGSMNREFERRYNQMTPILEAIAEQVDLFFDAELPAHVEKMVERRAVDLTAREAILGGFATSVDESSPHAWIEEPPAGPDPVQVLSPAQAELDVASRMVHRLSPKSFEAVQEVIRCWADSVQQNPIGFSHLHEDHLSDVLAATLNATTPGARRETFSRAGRSDIHITADVLGEGPSPAVTFICEAKWIGQQSDITEALKIQLFRYLPAHSTSAILVALSRRQDFDKAQRSILGWSQSLEEFQSESAGAVQGWPVFRYEVDERTVDVCIAIVHIPVVTTRAGKPK